MMTFADRGEPLNIGAGQILQQAKPSRAEPHPLAGQFGLPGNIVMVYGPRDENEVAVVTDLLHASHDYANERAMFAARIRGLVGPHGVGDKNAAEKLSAIGIAATSDLAKFVVTHSGVQRMSQSGESSSRSPGRLMT